MSRTVEAFLDGVKRLRDAPTDDPLMAIEIESMTELLWWAMSGEERNEVIEKLGSVVPYGAGADCKSVVETDSPGSIPGAATK